ncbi:Aste57867_8777 [Aphanomyces stellatus]|uniref:Aste57867_8777 protein n=1 Tax=Aphanomyces stellatus TaxID=120398 RepID=A0A485KLA9_9STRA|nr:hypothetical protein As57867_008743 [Aphanomyces stellatus]VFT85663.1 Aste57867_8777 [Aphanomyces stellatus]
MEVEKVNWQRANKINKKSGTHWRNAKDRHGNKLQQQPPPPTAEHQLPAAHSLASQYQLHQQKRPSVRKSLPALFRTATDLWTTSDVVTWLGHLHYDAIGDLAAERQITGGQLLEAHLGLSDMNLRALFGLPHGDTQWKGFVREVATLHRQHAQRLRQDPLDEGMLAPSEKLPALASPRKTPKKGGGRPKPHRHPTTHTCWRCCKLFQCDPERFVSADGKWFCSTACQDDEVASDPLGVGGPETKTPRTPATSSARLKQALHHGRVIHKGTAAFAPPIVKPTKTTEPSRPLMLQESLLMAQSIHGPTLTTDGEASMPLSTSNASTRAAHPTRRSRRLHASVGTRKPPIMPPTSLAIVSSQSHKPSGATTMYSKYYLEAVAAPTLSSVFLTCPLVSLLASYLRPSSWCHLTMIDVAWDRMAREDDSTWSIVLQHTWSSADTCTTHAPLIDADVQVERAKKRSARATLRSLAKRVRLAAINNLKHLISPETWQLAVPDTGMDTLMLAVAASTGEIVAVVGENRLIQTLADDATTIGVLQGLDRGDLRPYTCQRLQLCSARVPPMDTWSTCRGHAWFTLEPTTTSVPKKTPLVPLAVLKATARKMRQKMHATLVDLAKRAKKEHHMEACATVESILLAAKL